MSRGPLAGSYRSPRLLSLAPALMLAMSLAACFDSDEKPVTLMTPSGTTGVVPPSTTSSTGLGTSSSSGTPDVTCRDAIDCVLGCATELQLSELPEPDLTCFLECEEGLTVGEALHLFRLTECATNECVNLGVCDILVPTETSGSSSSSSSSSGDSSSSGSSGTDSGTTGPAQPTNPCLDCILAYIRDPNPGGACQPLADACV